METKTEIQEFSEKLAAIMQEYLNKIPLPIMAKVLASHQVDVMALHAQAVASHLVQAAQQADSIVQVVAHESVPE